MTETTPDVEARLRERIRRATSLPWELQDGCSWRRIGNREGDGNVICPTVHHRDGHPDLMSNGGDTYANLELIVEAVNALPGLLATITSLRAQLAEKDEALKRIAEMTDIEADFDGFEARARARTALGASK